MASVLVVGADQRQLGLPRVLREIDSAASKIKVEGARHPEKTEQMTGLR